MSASESATSRLDRLLTMVPWLLNRQGVDIAEAAAAFGVTPAQVEADLALLFLCGTPGGMPDDLIEAEWEGGKVFLGNAETISRPLRLGVDEALTLLIGLRTLEAVPGLGDRAVIDRTRAKLEEATGSRAAQVAGRASSRIQVDLTEGAQTGERRQWLAALSSALRDHRRVHLRYLVPARDETTERDVDPMRLTSLDGRWYLEGWCHRSEDVRLFRLDRIEQVTVLADDGTPPATARPRDLDAGIFQPREDDLTVVLELDQAASWVADYYPCQRVDRTSGDGLLITLRTADLGWLRRLLWRLGEHARAVHPAQLVAEVAAGAEHALANYVHDEGG